MATKVEVRDVLAYMASGVDVSPTKHQAMVYHDLLHDLPLPVLQAAAKRALLEHEYRTLPPVGLIRRLADEIQHGRRMSADEAWRVVQDVLRHWDEYQPQRFAEVRSQIPREIDEAATAVGWNAIRVGERSVVFGQFARIWNAKMGEDQRRALLPPSLSREISRLSPSFAVALPSPGGDEGGEGK